MKNTKKKNLYLNIMNLYFYKKNNIFIKKNYYFWNYGESLVLTVNTEKFVQGCIKSKDPTPIYISLIL